MDAGGAGRGRAVGRRTARGGAWQEPVQAALAYLARRARTTAQVRGHLQRRGFRPEAIRGAVERLRQLGYLDDRELAARYIAWTASRRPMGRVRIAAELARRGVTRGTIQEALQASFGAREEARALRRALSGIARGLRGPADDRVRHRVAARLLRRGFRRDDVLEALEAWPSGRLGGDEGEGEET